MKKLFSLVLTLILVFSMSVTAFAAELPDGSCVIKTWQTVSGETITGIITRASEDLVVSHMNPDNSDEARGIITHGGTAGDDAEISPLGDVSDCFYIRIINSNGQVVCTYQIVLKGKVTATSRAITNLGINYVSGTRCLQDWAVDGNTTYAAITHPALGTMDGTFTLDLDGTFYVS